MLTPERVKKKRVSDSLEFELQEVVSLPIWVP